VGQQPAHHAIWIREKRMGSHLRMPVSLPVGAEIAVTPGDLRILVEEAAEPVASENADVVVGDRGVGPAVGWSLAEGPVRPVGVVVIDVFAEDVVEVSSAGDEDAVGALAPRAGDPPLADRVRPRRLDRCGDDPHAGRGEGCVERVGVLGIPVSDQEFQSAGPLAEVHEDVPGLLDRPGGGGVGGDAGQVNAAIVVLDDEQHMSRQRKTVSMWKKSTAAIVLAWAGRNCFQLAAARCGAGSIPAALRISQMVEGAILCPRPVSSPRIRR